MHYFSKSLLALALVSVISGCDITLPIKPVTEDTEAFASKVIAQKITVAADAQRDYAALVASNRAVVAQKQVAIDTDEVDVDYIGAPQDLLQTMAHRYGYRYIESGKRVDLLAINVRQKNVSPIELLRSVGYQIDTRADVELNKVEKTLRLIYKTRQVKE